MVFSLIPNIFSLSIFQYCSAHSAWKSAWIHVTTFHVTLQTSTSLPHVSTPRPQCCCAGRLSPDPRPAYSFSLIAPVSCLTQSLYFVMVQLTSRNFIHSSKLLLLIFIIFCLFKILISSICLQFKRLTSLKFTLLSAVRVILGIIFYFCFVIITVS